MNRNDDGRLFVVANRLPVNLTQTEDGEFKYNTASGGLVSALQGLSKSMEFQWFGWPGAEIHRNDREMVRQELATRFHAVPIFLPKKTAERHYNGFSSKSVPFTLGVRCRLTDKLRFCPLASSAQHARQSRVQ